MVLASLSAVARLDPNMTELEKLDLDLLKLVGSLESLDEYRRLRAKWSRELCLEFLVIMRRIKGLDAEISAIQKDLARVSRSPNLGSNEDREDLP